MAGRLGGLRSWERRATGIARQWLGRESERDREIKRLRKTGHSVASIAKLYGISRTRVYKILERDKAA